VPTIKHVAVLVHAADRSHDRVPGRIAAEARALGVRRQRVEVDDPGTFDRAFGKIATSGVDALMIMDSAMFSGHRHCILDFARTSRLPTVCGGRQYAEAGCLVSYSPNHLELFRRAAVFVDKILKGRRLAELAAQHRLPAISEIRAFTEVGGLLTYGPSPSAQWRRAAYYVDRLLKDAKPSDLPVELPTKFELVINLKTAQALGLTIPPTLLFQADEVIR
jgi:ABC-type uncharacterized transport system substrate-binding protein